MEKEKKLEVKNLKISFRTYNGKVQAVRDISFDLYKEDTLAIVGESGSGKSVTSKAILGILAGNAIIEGGEIIYDGKNLLSIPEEEFHKIRGDKIAMIFQDPLSSLNPIMRIGKQLTEAMLLKGKARQKESKKNFNTYLKLLSKNIIEALALSDKAKADEINKKCAMFDKFERKHCELEKDFNFAIEAAEEAYDDIAKLTFELEKKSFKDVKYRVYLISSKAKSAIHPHIVNGENADKLNSLIAEAAIYKKNINNDPLAVENLIKALKEIAEILSIGINAERVNYFTLGYYLTFSDKELPNMPTAELNEYLHKYLDDNFMLNFIDEAKNGIINSAKKAYEIKNAVLSLCDQAIQYFSAEGLLDSKVCKDICSELSAEVNKSIDRLEIHKDSIAYTFATSFKKTIATYFTSMNKNAIEQKRFDKQTAKYERIIAKNKIPDWKVAPLALVDLEACKEDIVNLIQRLKDNYSNQLLQKEERDYAKEAIGVIDYLKANASGVVAKITKSMAKAKAIKLMEEVGISEPRKRYRQYPFEFSGGMRQRIVIAIALAANPDILICDEPTTALDVTIQAQILDLINELKRKRKLAVIFITHDLGVVANMADRIAVMYAGKIVETGTAEEVFYQPAHPYTWALLASMPDLDTKDKLEAIPGTPPNMIYPPKGDAFAERNKYALKIDFEQQPPMFKISDTHYAATWLLHPKAPKVNPPKIVLDRIQRMHKLNLENGLIKADDEVENLNNNEENSKEGGNE